MAELNVVLLYLLPSLKTKLIYSSAESPAHGSRLADKSSFVITSHHLISVFELFNLFKCSLSGVFSDRKNVMSCIVIIFI
jgi:hypothetical protein